MRELDGDEWVVNGQKVWTSLAHVSHWCFVVARTDPESSRHKGLSFLLVPMDQPGVEVRPIVQPTGGGEFNEVFFDDARTEASLVVGEVDDGWSDRDGPARVRARRVDARAAGRLRARARPRARPRARDTIGRGDPRSAHAARRRVDRAAAHEVERDAEHGGEGRARARGVDLQAVLGHVAPRPRQPR